jgi:hypothetical protein
MTREEIIKGLLDSEKGNNGIGILKLGPVPNYEKIKKEVETIIDSFPASYILSKEECRPYIKEFDIDLKKQIADMSKAIGKENKTNEQIQGANRIYKLFRESPGWPEDCKDYVKYSNPNDHWKFHFSDEFPNIGKYIEGYPNLVRFWINGLMPGTRFIPHREILTWPWRGDITLIPRIHVPFMSDSSSIFNINGYNYNLEEGNAYFVNIGAYHYASNDSNIPRYHFLIDSILDENLLSMFQNAEIPTPVSYTEKEEIKLEHDKRSPIDLDLQTYNHIRILK